MSFTVPIRPTTNGTLPRDMSFMYGPGMTVTPEPTLENMSQYLMKPEYVRSNLTTLDIPKSTSEIKTGPIINQPMLNVINEILVLEMRRIMAHNGIKEYNEFEIMNISELKRLFGTFMFINDSSSYEDLGKALTKDIPYDVQEYKRQNYIDELGFNRRQEGTKGQATKRRNGETMNRIDTEESTSIDKEMTGGRRRKNRTKKSSRRRHR